MSNPYAQMASSMRQAGIGGVGGKPITSSAAKIQQDFRDRMKSRSSDRGDDRPKIDKDALASILSGGASSVSPVSVPIYNPVMDDPYIVGDGEGDGLGTDAFGNTTYIGQQAPIEQQNLISNVSPVVESIVKPFYKDGRLDRDQLPEGSAYQDVFDIGLNVYPRQESPVGPLKYDIGFKPKDELLAEINSRNLMSFSPKDFENYITERKSYREMDAAQERFLRDKYRENNTFAGRVSQAIENPGRENLILDLNQRTSFWQKLIPEI